jgi:hypothetical protein
MGEKKASKNMGKDNNQREKLSNMEDYSRMTIWLSGIPRN